MINDQCPAELCTSFARVRFGPRPFLVQDCGMARHDLEDRLIRFGSTTCGLGERFPRTPLGQHVALQLVRSSTSPFANYGEVQSAESRRDFIHKLGICLKELRETRTWLKFVREMDMCSLTSLDEVTRECDELFAIMATSIRTARRNAVSKNRMSNAQ